ncbi:uncharacterized protein LOC115402940 isoform X2 [Salarias fasciatus]|uniref:uncharacterized protein LOC115402940 isoform X2 n=1 Tax=Salarias fasciatus TaxID=181472 RepID=UPI00117661B4|nr:uncharacterized protein LOC115402940 isoform X2 [Salarias fasciatus]
MKCSVWSAAQPWQKNTARLSPYRSSGELNQLKAYKAVVGVYVVTPTSLVAADRLLSGAHQREHITPILAPLHWLFVLFSLVPPMNVTIVETSDDTFECVSEGNPEPSIRWTRSNKTLPESDFRVDGGKLTFLRCASDLKGFYQCEVSNPYGQQSQQFYWTVCSGSNPAPWILFGLSFFLNIIGAVWYLYKSGHITRLLTNDETCSGDQRFPVHSSSPEVVPDSEGGRNTSSTSNGWGGSWNGHTPSPCS